MAELDPQVLPVETKLDENPNEESPTSKNTPFVVKRLVGQRDKLRENNSELDVENNDLANTVAKLTTENAQLKAQGQQSQQILPPDPDEFGSTEDYRQAQAKYTETVAQNAVGQVLNNQAAGQRHTQFETQVDSHYQQAEKLAKPDYEQAEVNAINELGQRFIDGIVENSDNSAETLYMLGNSPKELNRIKTLLATNPAKATLEIGRLSANAGSFNKETLPAPEDSLEPGGVIPNAAHGNLQKQHDDAIKRASETGDATGLRAIRRKMKDAGLLK